jgi:hypothetical protein
VVNDFWYILTGGSASNDGHTTIKYVVTGIIEAAVFNAQKGSDLYATGEALLNRWEGSMHTPSGRIFNLSSYQRWLKNERISEEVKMELLMKKYNLRLMCVAYLNTSVVPTWDAMNYSRYSSLAEIKKSSDRKSNAFQTDLTTVQHVLDYCDTYAPKSVRDMHDEQVAFGDTIVFSGYQNEGPDGDIEDLFVVKNPKILRTNGRFLLSPYFVGFMSFNFGGKRQPYLDEFLRSIRNISHFRCGQNSGIAYITRQCYQDGLAVENNVYIGKVVIKLFLTVQDFLLNSCSQATGFEVSAINRICGRGYQVIDPLELSRYGRGSPIDEGRVLRSCIKNNSSIKGTIFRNDIATSLTNCISNDMRNIDHELAYVIWLYEVCTRLPSSLVGTMRETEQFVIMILEQRGVGYRANYRDHGGDSQIFAMNSLIEAIKTVYHKNAGNGTIFIEEEALSELTDVIFDMTGMVSNRSASVMITVNGEMDTLFNNEVPTNYGVQAYTTIKAATATQRSTYDYLSETHEDHTPVPLKDLLKVSYSSERSQRKFALKYDLQYDDMSSDEELQVYVTKGDTPIVIVTGPGTRKLSDLRTDMNLVFGNLKNTAKFKRIESKVQSVIAKYKGNRFVFAGHSLMGSILSEIPYPTEIINDMKLITVNKGATLGTQVYSYELALRGDLDVISLLANGTFVYKTGVIGVRTFSSLAQFLKAALKAHSLDKMSDKLMI